MRIGLSATAKDLFMAVEKCNEYGCNHIEIGVDNISDWEYIKRQSESLRSHDVSIGVHMPLEMNPCERVEFIRTSWLDFLRKSIDVGSKLGVKYYNIHLGYGISSFVEQDRSAYLENGVRFLKKAAKLSTGSLLCIENMYDKGGYIQNLGTCSEDFEYIFENIKDIGFCFDLGHSLISQGDYISRFGENAKLAHISSNDGREDLHMGIYGSRDNDIAIRNILGLKNLEYVVLEMKAEYVAKSCEKIMNLI
ncbi:Endonuclease IV [Peptoclostridium litorale DSM 5388]|uniref:Xylose isomerase-like TIM barrel family protein n=1 Tax=Peptoclostridium litorale DSM 5388 TaxID=1121324 RepID=A0A069RN04_PEPLI|nr:TIM barrel protein [Peptoclostridium litorale]KDR95562.1 xylose isomerase-like TIM barrel family protein [Peptoclostridium litorale DSM 5388]SIN98339.1 Endonuclease IV [Peptoclostridium litorale DSM 5388]